MADLAHQQTLAVSAVKGRSKAPIVIIGAGPVGMRLFDRLAVCYPDQSIMVIGNENRLPYDRVQLSSVLAGQVRQEDISTAINPASAGGKLQYLSAHVTRIDRDNSAVIDSQGIVYPYQSLVLATGSRPFLPDIEGIEMSGVYAFRDMRDAESLAARRTRSKHTVVLGGGLLGIEAARAMQRHHTRVTVIDHNAHVMFRQLDKTAAARLEKELQSQGVLVLTRVGVRKVTGDGTVQSIELRDGQKIKCDTVIVAAGIRPNLDLARASGLSIGRGVRVNSSMRSSDPNIFAIGECCEYDGQVYGIVGPGFEQAEVCARNILSASDQRYRGSIMSSSLKVAGLAVFSMGAMDGNDVSSRSYVYETEAVYRRLNILNGRIVGAVAIGEWAALVSVKEAAAKASQIKPWQIWRFRKHGEIDSLDLAEQFQRLPAEAIVCNCNVVSKSAILKVNANKACNVEQLMALTGAGTGCGSCKPLLSAASGAVNLPRQRGYKPLFAVAAASLLIGLGALFVPGAPYAGTVQLDWHWDVLWTSQLNKQISGFTLLAVALISVLVSARKRLKWFASSDFALWRFAHVIIGLLALVTLGAHTGFRSGSNLNMALMTTFAGLAVAGAAMGLLIAIEHRVAPSTVRLLRSGGLWAHVLLCWPIPALLGLHVLKTYYF